MTRLLVLPLLAMVACTSSMQVLNNTAQALESFAPQIELVCPDEDRPEKLKAPCDKAIAAYSAASLAITIAQDAVAAGKGTLDLERTALRAYRDLNALREVVVELMEAYGEQTH